MQKMMVTITTLILMSAWIAVAAEDNTFFDKAQHYSNSVGDLTKLYVNQVNSPTGNYSLDDLLHDMGEHVDSSSITGKPKHILVVLTDDQGWADVGFRDESFVSPAMDYLATNGVILENFYVQVNRYFIMFCCYYLCFQRAHVLRQELPC